MRRSGDEDLSQQAAARLLEEIERGRYRTASRLPPETEMAAYLGVSRTVIRDALSALEMKGYVGRKRGLGTVVNRHVLQIRTRIDLEDEFLSMIARSGYHPGAPETLVSEEPADRDTMRQLLLEPGETVFRITRLITADGAPAVYCDDYFAKSLIRVPWYDPSELRQPVFQFLEHRCGQKITMGLSEVHAVAADALLSEKLRIREGDPVLQFRETRYNFDGMPILYSVENYREGLLSQVILRKNIGKWPSGE